MSNTNEQYGNMASPNYSTQDIPLQKVVSHTPSQAATVRNDEEKSGLFHRSIHGRRKLRKIDSKGQSHPGTGDADEEKTALNRMGRLYSKILNFSIVTRYMIYVTPLALALAVPIVVAVTLDKKRDVKEGPLTIGGVRMYIFFTWIEVGK